MKVAPALVGPRLHSEFNQCEPVLQLLGARLQCGWKPAVRICLARLGSGFAAQIDFDVCPEIFRRRWVVVGLGADGRHGLGHLLKVQRLEVLQRRSWITRALRCRI